MRENFEADMKKRTHLYKLPPRDFHPLTASDRALAEFGLPTRSGAENDLNLFVFWNLMLSAPLKFIRPEFKVHLAKKSKRVHFHHRRSLPRPRPPILSRIARAESSSNWSGAYLTPPFPNRFTKLTGSWHVPAPDVPDVPPDPPVPSGLEFRSSTWVGLDGHRTYPHASMPQAGTAQRVQSAGDKNTVKTFAWWQWWCQDGGTPEVEITNLPTTVGDRMLVSLTVQAPDEVQFNVKNQTTGDFVTFLVQAPPLSPPIGATAEWIMERPAEFGSNWLYRMPHCTDVNFTHCIAQSGASAIGPWHTHMLDHPYLIRMFEIFENPHRKAFVSIPKKLAQTSLRVSYREAV